MPDMTMIAHALGALKAAKDIAETMIGLRDTAAFQGKLLEFQSKIIDANNAVFAAQEERSSMLERIRELEKQVADFEEWKTKKEKYELKAVMPSAFAYMLKPEARGTAPPHWVCAQCYENRKISIMQLFGSMGLHSMHKCPACENSFRIGVSVMPTWQD